MIKHGPLRNFAVAPVTRARQFVPPSARLLRLRLCRARRGRPSSSSNGRRSSSSGRRHSSRRRRGRRGSGSCSRGRGSRGRRGGGGFGGGYGDVKTGEGMILRVADAILHSALHVAVRTVVKIWAYIAMVACRTRGDVAVAAIAGVGMRWRKRGRGDCDEGVAFWVEQRRVLLPVEAIHTEVEVWAYVAMIEYGALSNVVAATIARTCPFVPPPSTPGLRPRSRPRLRLRPSRAGNRARS